jgi:AcrR family transcriptional regulator
MAIQSKSRIAILAGAKKVIAEVGSYESNMIDIADRSEVSRATIYNHFVDKEEMMKTLLASEIDRLLAGAKSGKSKSEALRFLSEEISQDAALAKMVETDHDEVVALMTISDDPLWIHIHRELAVTFSAGESEVGLIIRWLLAQITSPLSVEQSRTQAEAIAKLL